MKVALIFAGQGADLSRVGRTLAARSARARELLGRASELVGLDLERASMRRPDELRRSEVVQPLLTALGLADAYDLRVRGVPVAVSLGLSLGEVAAWSAAGCVQAEDAIALAAVRGRAMAEAARRSPGGMVALVGCTEDEMCAALSRGRAHGRVWLAAHNAAREWVLAGDHAALRQAARGLEAHPLEVAGPWHSPAMSSAAAPYRAALESIERSPARAAFIAGVTGRVTAEDDIPDALVASLTEPVRWVRGMQTLGEIGVTDFVIAGPPRPVRSLLRRNLGAGVNVFDTEDALERDWPRAEVA